MHRILIVLSYVIFIRSINGASSRSRTSIERDTIELADLMQKIWASKPDEYNKIEPFTYCKVVETCCEQKQRQEAIPWFSLMSLDLDKKSSLKEIVESCVNSTEQNGGDKWCQTYSQEIIPLRDLWSNIRLTQFGQLMGKLDGKLKKFGGDVPHFCNKEETYAFICLSNKKLIQRCARKRLQYLIKSSGYKSYGKLVKELKKTFIDINEEWSAISTGNGQTN